MLSKSVFFTKLAISLLHAKFACVNLAANKFFQCWLIKFSSKNVFTTMIMINIFCYFNFTNFCVIVVFLTKLITLGILFSTEVRAAVVAKLVILGIPPLTSFNLALREALVAKLVILGI